MSDEAQAVSPDAIVIRFRPTDPASVLGWAEKEFRRSQRHRLSVFVGLKAEGQTDDDVYRILLQASELAGISATGNPKFFVCTFASELAEAGFAFYKDDYPGEPEEHYSVDLGASPTVKDVERFLTPFSIVERRST